MERVHFVGIGGIGMCGLAELLHHAGRTVTGSDLPSSALSMDKVHSKWVWERAGISTPPFEMPITRRISRNCSGRCRNSLMPSIRVSARDAWLFVVLQRTICQWLDRLPTDFGSALGTAPGAW